MDIETYGDMIVAFEKRMRKRAWQLSPKAQVLWYRLAYLYYRQGGKNFRISLKALSKRTGIAARTLGRVRDELIFCGYLELIPSAGYRANGYILHWPDEIELRRGSVA